MNKMRLSIILFICLLSMVFGQEIIEKEIETLSSFEITNDSIIVSVSNSGYTTKYSFVFEVNETDKFYEISLLRVKSDDGKMIPELIEVVFQYTEVFEEYNRTKPIRIMNTFSYFDLFW